MIHVTRYHDAANVIPAHGGRSVNDCNSRSERGITMTTDERFKNLEKGLASARRLNRWLLAAVGLALGVWILAGTFGPTMAAAQTAGAAVNEVRAKRFVLVDDAGKQRALLAVGGLNKPATPLDEAFNAASLYLYDPAGKPRAVFSATLIGPVLDLSDEEGKTRAMLTVFKEGPWLILYDENGKIIWQVPQRAPVAVTPGTK